MPDDEKFTVIAKSLPINLEYIDQRVREVLILYMEHYGKDVTPQNACNEIMVFTEMLERVAWQFSTKIEVISSDESYFRFAFASVLAAFVGHGRLTIEECQEKLDDLRKTIQDNN